MLGLVVKLFVFPTFVILSSFIFPQVYYANLFQPIVVGLLLAVSAHIIELFILKKGTLWISTVADFVAITILTFFLSLILFPTSYVMLSGAMLTALVLSITEVLQHLWLIQSGRAIKPRPIK
ncbi:MULTISPECIES: DUF2512 family protein [Bacillaceae]|uniref:DUF2512 family protein n=1 Tax=Bacillaceae TaxID=186817 RepID=UPI00047C812F|nr:MULTISPECIES: DUF2512 family protein [Bacillaceae]UOE96098.1 YndM family protein [Alkalihalobacillus sp. LMS39]